MKQLLTKIEASQESFDFNFDYAFKKEQEEAQKALDAIRSDVYQSPAFIRKSDHFQKTEFQDPERKDSGEAIAIGGAEVSDSKEEKEIKESGRIKEEGNVSHGN